MKVGLLIDDSLDRPDGVQQHVLTLGAWLTGQGHEVHYLTSTTARTDLPNLHSLGRNLRLRFNGNRLGTPLPVRRRDVRRLHAELGLDVLHVNMPYSPFLAGRVIATAPATTAVVGTFHILPWSTLTRVGTRLLGVLQRRQLRRFGRVIAVSAPAKEFAATALGVEPVVIGNPVDVARFASARPAADDVARRTGPVRVVFLGRLVERKGAGELLRAVVHARALPALDPHSLAQTPLDVVVAGTGPLEQALRAYVVEHGLESEVSFPGYVAEDAKAELLAGADVVALPSTGGESFGISVVEALAACPGIVLAGDNAGYRTVMAGLEDQLVDATDTPTFARVLARAVTDRDARAAAAERQAAQAMTFDVGTVGRQVLEVYAAAQARVVPPTLTA